MQCFHFLMCLPCLLAFCASAEQTQVAAQDQHGDTLPPAVSVRLGTVRYRASGFIGFLADAKTIVSASEQGRTFQFWDAMTGKLQREIPNEGISARSFTVSPDGKFFAAGGFLPFQPGDALKGAIGVWEASSGKQVRHFPRSSADTDRCSLAFSPDGKLLASLGRNGLLRIEEVASGVELLTQKFPADIGPQLAFSADGTMLAVITGPNSGKLFVWKWQAGEEPRPFKVQDRVGGALVFSPDGKVLAECGDIEREIRLWDVVSGQVARKLQPPNADDQRHTSVLFSRDGKTLIASARSNTGGGVHFWNATTWTHQKQIAVQTTGLIISSDGRLLAGTGRGLWVWDLIAGKDLSANDEAHQGAVQQVAAAGKVVATVAYDETIRLWDASGKHQLKLTHNGHGIHGIALSPDGSRMVSSSYDNSVCLWDTATGKKIYHLPGHGRLVIRAVVSYSSDGKHFYSWGSDLYLRKWDVATGKALLEHAIRPKGFKVPEGGPNPRDFEMLMSLGGAKFTPDGKRFVLSTGKQFHVLETATGLELGQFDREGGLIRSVDISSDSRFLLMSASGRSVQTKLPDGRTRISAANNHVVFLWDLTANQLRQQVILPDGNVGPVSFMPDGTHFAAASGGDVPRIRFWNVATGKEVGGVLGFRGVVRSMAYSPDGRKLITGMDDSTALIWDVADAMK